MIRLTEVNHCSVVKSDRRKVLKTNKVETPEPKGEWARTETTPFCVADEEPPA